MNPFKNNSCLLLSDLGPSDCASWVQAIGSIVAILVAIWVANRSASLARESYTQARVERLAEQVGPVIALIKAAERESKVVWDGVSKANHGGRWGLPSDFLDNLKSIRQALDSIEVRSMPSGDCATSLIDAKVRMGALMARSMWLEELAIKSQDITIVHRQDYEEVAAQLLQEGDKLRLELVRLTLPIGKDVSRVLAVLRRWKRP